MMDLMMDDGFETHGQSQPSPKQRVTVAPQNGDLSPQKLKKNIERHRKTY